MKEVGVSKSGKKWQVNISVNGKRTYFGTFSTLDDANEVAVAARMENPKYAACKAKPRTKYQGKLPSGTKAIQLSTGDYTFVSEADYKLLNKHKWSDSCGYAATKINRKKVFMHRLVLGVQEECDGLQVDHINRNKLDNRRENLRLVSRSDNMRNTAARSKSGYKGVVRQGRKFVAYVHHSGKTFYAGSFHTPEEANEAVIAKKKELGITIF